MLVGSYYIVITRSVVGSYDLYLDFLAQNACVEWLVSSRFRRRRLPLLGFVCVCLFLAPSFSRCFPCTLLCRSVSATTTHRARTGPRRRRRSTIPSFLPSFLLLLRLLLLCEFFLFFFLPLFSKNISMTIMHKERRRSSSSV